MYLYFDVILRFSLWSALNKSDLVISASVKSIFATDKKQVPQAYAGNPLCTTSSPQASSRDGLVSGSGWNLADLVYEVVRYICAKIYKFYVCPYFQNHRYAAPNNVAADYFLPPDWNAPW